MLVRPKLEYASPIWNPHTSSQINRLEIIQHYAARFVANDHRQTTSPTTLVLTLNWQTLERRRTINQAMTYKILNNIIEINPPTGLLTRSHNRHHFTIKHCSILILPQSHPHLEHNWVIPCQINRFLTIFPRTPSDSFEIWHTCRNCLETNICPKIFI